MKGDFDVATGDICFLAALGGMVTCRIYAIVTKETSRGPVEQYRGRVLTSSSKVCSLSSNTVLKFTQESIIDVLKRKLSRTVA